MHRAYKCGYASDLTSMKETANGDATCNRAALSRREREELDTQSFCMHVWHQMKG